MPFIGTRDIFLQICFISCIFLLFIDPGTGSNQVFQGEVLGHLGDFGIAGVSPPNYTGTLPHYDVAGYDNVIFRLSYSGETPAEITHLDVTQEITSFGQTWNYSHASVELSSPLTLVSGASATFQVTGSPYFIEGGLFYVKITTTNLGICWITFSSVGIHQSLSGWPLSTSPSVTTGSLTIDSTLTFTSIDLLTNFFNNIIVEEKIAKHLFQDLSTLIFGYILLLGGR